MRKIVMISLALALCSGCAALKTGEGNVVQRYSGSRQLEQADEMLARGNTQGAAKLLNEITSGPSVAGVTDEALFKLALLALKPGVERYSHGQQLLRRLGKEFPKSSWNRLAAPVADMIEAVEEQKHQNRNLKGTNQSLTKEISELNKSIEQLKRLDLELEKSAR